MPPFLVCIHDATPAHARATRAMIRGLAPLVGRRFSFGVVPDWHGEWPLVEHLDYCKEIKAASEELLLHGYFHRRQRGWGPTTFITGGSDEMNGLDREETRKTIERGQHVFSEVFGEPARGFLAPGWQAGHVRPEFDNGLGLQHVLGFFSLRSSGGRSIRLATWTWDSSRWEWTGHLSHGIGWMLQSMHRGVPTLAIHPRDLERGFWSKIVRLTHQLLDAGYEPTTIADLLEPNGC